MIPAHILLTTEGASLLLLMLMLKDDQSATRNKEKSMEGTRRDRFVMHAVLERAVLAMVPSAQALFTLERVAVDEPQQFQNGLSLAQQQ